MQVDIRLAWLDTGKTNTTRDNQEQHQHQIVWHRSKLTWQDDIYHFESEVFFNTFNETYSKFS
jgi:hypothetical protein